MTKDRHAARRQRASASIPAGVDKDMAQNMAKAIAYLDATHDQFMESLGNASRYFDGTSEGGVLAGPIVRR